MTVADLHPNVRVRLARIPEYLPRDHPKMAEQIGKTGLVIEVSTHGTAVVQWDDGSQGAWLPQYLDPVGGP